MDKMIKTPKEVYPLVVMIGSVLVGAAGFTFSSLFHKAGVYVDKKKRMSLFK